MRRKLRWSRCPNPAAAAPRLAPLSSYSRRSLFGSRKSRFWIWHSSIPPARRINVWLSSAGPVLSASGGDLAPSRNFFTGQLYGENGWRAKVEPFYSAAFVTTNETIHVGLDGRARLYDANAKSLATFSGWGSDLTTLKTNCGSSWQVLATRAGDWTEPDAIQAYEIHEREVVAVSGPVNLPGPVMSLGPETP